MKILKQILLISFFISVAGCALGDTVEVRYTKTADLPIEKGRFLVAPLVIQTLDRLNEDSATKIFLQYCETRENVNLEFLAHETVSLEVLNKTISKIITDEAPDVSYFSSENIDYIITGIVYYETRFFADRVTNDKMNPAYSADYGGYPGFWETSEEWRRRSFTNLVFEVRTEIHVWSIKLNKNIFKKKYSNFYILEEYREKNVRDERDNAYQILLQETARQFLTAFYPGIVRAQRVYMR